MRRNWEEHEDEQDKLEGQRTVLRSQDVSKENMVYDRTVIDSRQVAEQSKLVSKAEARGQHRCTGNAAPCHAPYSQHVAGVDGRIAKRSEGEESHGRSEDDHAEYH